MFSNHDLMSQHKNAFEIMQNGTADGASGEVRPPNMPPYFNSTEEWHREQWGGFAINLIPIIPFLVLTGVVIALMVGRGTFRWLFCSCRKGETKHNAPIGIHLLGLSMLAHCVYHIIVSILYALSDIFDVPAMSALAGVLLFLHYFIFSLVAVSFLDIWLSASKNFHMFVKAKAQGGNNSSEEQKHIAQQKMQVLFAKLRIAIRVLLAVDTVIIAVLLTIVSIGICLQNARVITANQQMIIMGILLPLWVVVLATLGLLAIILGAQLVYGLRQASKLLVQQSTLTKANKHSMKRLQIHKVTVVKLTIGIVLFVIHMIMLAIGTLLWILVHKENTYIIGAILNLFVLRTIPTALLLGALILVFWPWPLPEFMVVLFVCGSDRRARKLAARPMLIEDADVSEMSTAMSSMASPQSPTSAVPLDPNEANNMNFETSSEASTARQDQV